MMLKLLIVLTLLNASIAQYYNCSQKSALVLLKRPAYEFSMKILDRVAFNNEGHFVFSPLSTWLQLTALAEGAQGETLREIWKLTRHHRNKCFKRKLGGFLRKLTRELKHEYRRKSVIAINELMDVKKSYISDVQKFYGVKVLLENFAYPVTSASDVNTFVSRGTNGVIKEAVYADDFNNTMLLMTDNLYFKSSWKYPFKPAYTKTEPFKSFKGEYIANVNMMSMTGYFNMTEMPIINAKVLEIPCVHDFSMLLFLPMNDARIEDLFFVMQQTKLNSIFNMFKSDGEKLVHVKVPRFRINSTVDNLPELVSDMNVNRIFDPNLSELPHISDFGIYASLMAQVADIEVTEEGVRARASNFPDFLVNKTNKNMNEFVANIPFGYILIDRKSQFILFAGIYSYPSLY